MYGGMRVRLLPVALPAQSPYELGMGAARFLFSLTSGLSFNGKTGVERRSGGIVHNPPLDRGSIPRDSTCETSYADDSLSDV